MILTQCPVCAAQLPPLSAKQCSRCKTRYCGRTCQEYHWKEGGHDKLCKKIRKNGGAEQYHANKKYTEAVAIAAKACAEDTKGQTCYICTQALHWKTKEGLVRGCSCRGTAGFAHVSCLAEQAKILYAEAEENNLGVKALAERWARWHACSLCEQHYHGVVRCALGWACFKTYLGRPETDLVRIAAMTQLANGLYAAGHYADALVVQEADLSMLRRIGAPQTETLVVQNNLANTYDKLKRREEALRMRQDVYSGRYALLGKEHGDTLLAANNYSTSLNSLQRSKEAKGLLRKMIPVARHVLGESNETTLQLRANYAIALYMDDSATPDDLREAVATLEDAERITRRVFGSIHPFTMQIDQSLRQARAVSDYHREGDVERLREAVAAMTPGDA